MKKPICLSGGLNLNRFNPLIQVYVFNYSQENKYQISALGFNPLIQVYVFNKFRSKGYGVYDC